MKSTCCRYCDNGSIVHLPNVSLCTRCHEAYRAGATSERAAIVAWLLSDEPGWCAAIQHQISADYCDKIADIIERADHLRADIEGGEGETK